MKLIKALIGNSNDDNKFSWGILLLRIFLSALMLTHGFAKLNNFETLSTQFPDILGIGGEWNLILVILAEFGCSLLIILLFASISGYVFSVLKEKICLKNNMIIINKKSVTQEHLDETDMKEFILDGYRIKAGDEVKVVLNDKKRLAGIIIGAKRKERAILLVTYKDEVKKLCIDNIIKFRVISKYGKFFKTL